MKEHNGPDDYNKGLSCHTDGPCSGDGCGQPERPHNGVGLFYFHHRIDCLDRRRLAGKQSSLVIQNAVLLLINILGVWHWLPKAEKEAATVDRDQEKLELQRRIVRCGELLREYPSGVANEDLRAMEAAAELANDRSTK